MSTLLTKIHPGEHTVKFLWSLVWGQGKYRNLPPRYTTLLNSLKFVYCYLVVLWLADTGLKAQNVIKHVMSTHLQFLDLTQLAQQRFSECLPLPLNRFTRYNITQSTNLSYTAIFYLPCEACQACRGKSMHTHVHRFIQPNVEPS